VPVGAVVSMSDASTKYDHVAQVFPHVEAPD